MSKVSLLLWLLVGFPLAICAQEGPATYTDPKGYFQLTHASTWTMRTVPNGSIAFAPADAGPTSAAAVVLTQQVLPDEQTNRSLAVQQVQDSIWRDIRRMPRSQVVLLSQHDAGQYSEISYDYTYAVPPPGSTNRAHVLGRALRRGGSEYRLEYRGQTDYDGRYLNAARALVESFVFTTKSFASRRYDEQTCDNKFYGIAALRMVNGQWLDDCRTIHEFPNSNLAANPIVHRNVLPFQAYAITKGFDNALYAVTKAPTDQPELVYRYDPATRKGGYTPWKLPAQGEDITWISAATDEAGDLFFITSDANQLVKINPRDGSVRQLWTSDPLRRAPFFSAINFAHAGSHANFCLDDSGTMYLVYSTDGSIMKIDVRSRRPYPELVPLDGLPKRGGYSGLQMQNDAQGRRRLYLAGPHALYTVDMAKHRATRVRSGTYTDLAGCNLFQLPHNSPPAPKPPTTSTWQGRVLNADTYQPLPEAQLRLGPEGLETLIFLTSRGNFSYRANTGKTYTCHAQLPGYIATDSSWLAGSGPIVRDILLHPLAVGTIHKLANVQFEQGKATLLPSSNEALDQLINLMVLNPNMHIELRGHTDNVGPPEKNVVLSQQRVAAVKRYLVARGLVASRITGMGFGGEQPIASNEEEETRRLNRRVEFRVTSVE